MDKSQPLSSDLHPDANSTTSFASPPPPSHYPAPLAKIHDPNEQLAPPVFWDSFHNRGVPIGAADGLKMKRLLKNRESAARSRARKEAYTLELEEKVGRLMEENAKLKQQIEKMREEAVVKQIQKKSNNLKLRRTLTASF